MVESVMNHDDMPIVIKVKIFCDCLKGSFVHCDNCHKFWQSYLHSVKRFFWFIVDLGHHFNYCILYSFFEHSRDHQHSCKFE